MADQTDRLTTIISLQGLGQSVAGLNQLAKAAQGVESPLSILNTRMQILPGLMARLNVGTALAAGGWKAFAAEAFVAVSALQQIGRVMAEGIRIADQYNQSLIRTLALVGNRGGRATAGGLASFALSRLGQTGISEESTLNLAGQMAERGFGQRRIAQLLPALQDIQQGSGGKISAESAMQMFLRVLERPLQQGGRGGAGGGRGLLGLATNLGINIRFTGSIERDLNALTQAIREKFGGVAEAMNAVASGVHLRFQALLTAALGRLGSIIEIILAPALSHLADKLLGLINTMDQVQHGGQQSFQSNLLMTLIGALPGGLFFQAAILANRQREAQAAGRAGGQNQEMLDHLAHIDANTQRMASALITTVFGNISAFTRGAASFRNLNTSIRFG